MTGRARGSTLEQVSVLLAVPALDRPAGTPPTRLIGRSTEVTALLGAVRRTRLLSLAGPGGSGKTRLGHAVADRLAGDRPVWWVSLAQLDRPALLLSAVADALRVADVPGRSLHEAVTGFLRTHDGLLVLDNCEHLVARCAALAGDLLRACPGLRILTTSREPLAVAGETVWWVRGLSVPAERPAPTAAALAGSQAVRLFTDRARLVVPDFAVTDANAADVAQLCRRLDGLPLALELAAASLRMLALPRIVAWLDDAVSLLVTTDRDVPPRQATLRATLDWSHDLLPGPERELFARLSVFRGGFTLPAAAAVAGSGTLETLRLLTRLADKSLVQARVDGAEERYRLLEVVRQYAAERLGDQGPATAARHARLMLDLAEHAEQGMSGAEQQLWLERLHRDEDNLRAALSWSRRHDPGLTVRLAGALARYWRLRGHYSEGRQWLEAAVRAAGADIAPAARAKALTALGTLEYLQCEYAPAAARLGHARDLYATAGDERGVAAALQSLGSIAREQGSFAEARRHHDAGLAIWRRRGDPAGVARAYQAMGFTAWLEGDHARAIALSSDAVRRFRELGDAEGEAGTLVDLAAATYRHGDPEGARPLLRQSLTLAERLGFKEAAAWAGEQLGLVAAAHGERAEAVTLLRQSLAVHHELGDRWRTASVLETLAGLHVDPPTSARLLAAAARLRKAIGTPLPPSESSDHDRRAQAVRTALGPRELGRATTEGRALSVAQAVELALADPRPAPEAAPATLVVAALGGARVALAGRVLGPDDWTYAKPRELFFHLLTRPGATKAEIGLALWPEASRAELRNSFHTCLKYLRRALGPAVRIRYADGAYHLEPVHGLRYDVEEFRNAATTASVEALTEAAAHYRGDFLGDTPAGAWVEPHREELRREYEQVLRRLGGLLARDRRYLAAVEVFTRLVAHDPLLEAAHRGLMRCHAALGDRARALRQYHDLAELLDTQLGTVPAPETTQLYTGIRERK